MKHLKDAVYQRVSSIRLHTWFILVTAAVTVRAADSPNIVLILADDLGYGDLSCFGQSNFETPHLDRMASEGMRFTQHYAGSTVCAPSRACLMTGLHTGHVYNRSNDDRSFREDPLDTSVATRLRRAGYHTALIGKSGFACWSADGGLPNRKGFDHFFGFIDHGEAHRHYPDHLWRNGKRVEIPGNHGTSGDRYAGDLFLCEALQYLEERAPGERPFFLHLALQQPHADLAAPGAWRARFVDKFQETPFEGGHYRAESHPRATYAAMVSHLDHTVGRILDRLQELGIAERTLVIFTSDNGAMSEGGWSRENFDSSGPLRGGKRDLYEGGIRVPTIAWWPGVISHGAVSDHISAFWDFVPTACELAGLKEPEGVDGVSYAPTLRGLAEQPGHECLYWEFYEQGGKQALRWGDWKAVRLNVRQDPKTRSLSGDLELYDLANDLEESDNVADSHPDVVRRVEALMAEAHEPSETVSYASKQEKQEKHDGKLRIVALGDSITHGDTSYRGYRYWLWRHLIDAGWDFDLVGSHSGPWPGDGGVDHPDYKEQNFDDDHEGHSGWTTSQIRDGNQGSPGLKSWLSDYTPDIALVHIGTNDVWTHVNDTDASVVHALASLSDIIDLLRADNPSVRIYISQIIPYGTAFAINGYDCHAFVARFNSGVEHLAVDRTTGGSPVIPVDHHTGFGDGHLRPDGIHPNRAGEQLMALRWMEALLAHEPRPRESIPPHKRLPPAKLVDKSSWKIFEASSESRFNGATAEKAFDGDPWTWWHSEWRDNAPPHPHHLIIDLGEEARVAGARVLPRQDGKRNGRVNQYAIYLGNNARSFGEPVAVGRLADVDREQEVRFERVAVGRYLKVDVLSEFLGSPYASIGEIDLLAE